LLNTRQTTNVLPLPFFGWFGSLCIFCHELHRGICKGFNGRLEGMLPLGLLPTPRPPPIPPLSPLFLPQVTCAEKRGAYAAAFHIVSRLVWLAAARQVRLVGAAGERELEGQLLRRCIQRATQLGLPHLQVPPSVTAGAAAAYELNSRLNARCCCL
jgi:hypothetical protein